MKAWAFVFGIIGNGTGRVSTGHRLTPKSQVLGSGIFGGPSALGAQESASFGARTQERAATYSVRTAVQMAQICCLAETLKPALWAAWNMSSE